jgi:hypothetical protein
MRSRLLDHNSATASFLARIFGISILDFEAISNCFTESTKESLTRWREIESKLDQIVERSLRLNRDVQVSDDANRPTEMLAYADPRSQYLRWSRSG